MSDSKSPGPGYIAVGLGVTAITLIGMTVSGLVGTEPLSGSGSLLMALGLPVGIGIAILGVFTTIRQGRR
jgi:hypothetical protein